MIYDKLQELMMPNAEIFRPVGILREQPHMTWDNYFSGHEIFNYAAENGFGLTMTCRRDRLPKEVPAKHWHKEKTDTKGRSRAARFEQPVVAIKKIGENSLLQLTSFQSTSSTNIYSVNAHNSVSLYARTREQGRGVNKRKWAIEMNEARALYLSTYGQVDRMDHLIQNCNMHYRSWKYWHSPMIHAKAMAAVIAYDIYLECCQGKMLAGEWKIEKPVTFHRFREKLYKQMLQYSPRNRKYAGDQNFRIATQEHVNRRVQLDGAVPTRRRNATSDLSSGSSITSGITMDDFDHASTRLCGNLTPLYDHLKSVATMPNNRSKVCAVCGKDTTQMCTKCSVALHRHSKKEEGGVPCFFHYHNTDFFGLAKNDYYLAGKRKKDWTFPTLEDQEEHRHQVRRIHHRRQESSSRSSTTTTTRRQLPPLPAVPVRTPSSPDVNEPEGTMGADGVRRDAHGNAVSFLL